MVSCLLKANNFSQQTDVTFEAASLVLFFSCLHKSNHFSHTAAGFGPSEQLMHNFLNFFFGGGGGDRSISFNKREQNPVRKRRKCFRLNYHAFTPPPCTPPLLFSWHLAAVVGAIPLTKLSLFFAQSSTKRSKPWLVLTSPVTVSEGVVPHMLLVLVSQLQ